MQTFLHALVIGGLLLMPAGWVSAETIFDLADAVGGGDGSLPGTGGTGDLAVVAGVYTPYPDKPFVDGTFAPNNTAVAAVIDGAGNTYDFDSQTSQGVHLAWCNGLNLDMDPSSASEVPDFTGDPDNHSLLSAHANKGITFDLQAVRDATGLTPISFTTWAGDSRTKGGGSICYYVFVDGVLKANRNNITNDEDFLTIGLGETDRYLTLAISDANDGINSDHGYFGDPFLHMVPEPSSAVLTLLGLIGLTLWGWRRR